MNDIWTGLARRAFVGGLVLLLIMGSINAADRAASLLPALERNYVGKAFYYPTSPLFGNGIKNRRVQIKSVEVLGGDGPLYWYALSFERGFGVMRTKCQLSLGSDSSLWCPELATQPFTEDQWKKLESTREVITRRELEGLAERQKRDKAEKDAALKKAQLERQRQEFCDVSGNDNCLSEDDSDWSKEVWRSIRRGQVSIGMTREQCWRSWGIPSRINRTTSSYGIHEQWVYYSHRYLYFEDGILRTIQD